MGLFKIFSYFVLILILGAGGYFIGSHLTIAEATKTNFTTTRIDDGITLTFVSGTEYYFGDLGKTIIQILNKDQKVLNGTCNQTILYHNSSVFLQAPMSVQDITGNYYDFFVIPPVSGVYTVNVKCEVTYNSVTKNMTNSKTFHVSNATSKIIEVINQNSSTILNNIVYNINRTEATFTLLNQTNNYITGHVNDHLHNISTDLTVLANESNIMINLLNNTYNLVFNNVTNSFSQVMNISTQINNTVNNNALDLSLIMQYLGIKPFNLTMKLFSNTIVSKNQIWLVQAEVRDQYSRLYPNATCTLTSIYTGLKSMPYNTNIKRYEFQSRMNTTGVIPFQVSCVK